MKELDTLIGKLYETYTLEKISDRQYKRLMNQYEDEYGELEAMVEELVPDKEEQTPKSAMDSFIALAKKYADFEELTPTMTHEFIDKIVVHESNGVRGFGRKQKIEIYFNFIGQFIPPYSTAELKAEAKEQAVKKAEKDRIRAEKRAETVKRYKENKAKRLAQLKADAEAGDPKAIAEYEEYCRNEEKKREQSKAYFKERYRREQEKYKATKALAEQGDSRAVELLTEYDRRIEHKKQVASEREKAKRRAKRKVS